MATSRKNQDTTAIRDIAYKEVETKLKNNMSSYKRYISSFMSARSQQFYSHMPSQQIYFTEKDAEEFFKSTKIDKAVITDAIHHTYYWDIAQFNPRYAKDECTMALLCVVRYFNQKNMKKELELALINLSFSGKFYPSRFHASYPTVQPQDYVMDYVVTHMCTNKYDIVIQGNVVGAVKSIATTWLKTYQNRIKEFTDDDCQYLVQQLHNRIASFISNIAELYYEAYKNKDRYITYDSDDVSEDNYHLANNDSFILNNAVEATMTQLDSKGINYKLLKLASNDLVKVDELKSILENLIGNNANIPLIKEFISLLVVNYFKESKNRDLRDIEFVSFSITPKPNTKDPYVIKQKELLNQMLLNNSEHFARRRSRAATESAYYRSINAYFSLLIQQSCK